MPADEMSFDTFWAMRKSEQADLIWKKLFVERTPISEACRGVVTTLSSLGLDPNERDLSGYRKWFAEQDAETYVDRVMELTNVDRITMTNEVFDPHEHQLWLDKPNVGDDPRFAAVLRVDKLVVDWPVAATFLRERGYSVDASLGGSSIDEIKRFLGEWIDRMKAVYVAMSLPPQWRFPVEAGDTTATFGEKVLTQCMLPVLAQRDMPLALMIGAQRQVNPALQLAGDMGFASDVGSLVRLCATHADNRFLVTMLGREDQHELAVAARKFRNLLIFGCWWFLNIPSQIEQITKLRLELLGTTFCPQHSDARVLDQLVYKWKHSRTIIGKVLTEKYEELAAAGGDLSEQRIKNDIALLMRDNFRNWVGMK
ncbi:MAG: hypothetical protein MI741_19130, partial [Rhodospirillales bacterium]|nr:hypothetical protein [Rhodospirillales bacterium]